MNGYKLQNEKVCFIKILYTEVLREVCPVYDPYIGECLLERTLVLGYQLFEEGWPVPFLAAFIPQCFHQVPIYCWVNSEWVSNHRSEVGLKPWSSPQ